MAIKTIKVSSRRSTKIGDEFFTYEMTVEADVPKKEDVESCTDELWEFAHNQVDKQIADAIKDLTKKK